MKNIFAITAILLIITATANKAIAITEPDSIHSYQYIDLIYHSDFERAMTLCDEAVAMNMMEQYKALYIKGKIMCNNGNYKKCSEYFKQAIESDECKQDSAIYINIISTIGELYRIDGRLEDAMQIAVNGLELARKANNITWEGRFLTNIGICLLEMGKDEEGFEHLRKAESILDAEIAKTNSLSPMKGLLTTLYYLTQRYAMISENEEALRTGLKHEQTVMKIMDTHLVDDGFADVNFSDIYPTIAQLYERLGNHKEAEKYFKKWESLKIPRNSYMVSEIIGYLVASGQLDKALAYNKKHLDEHEFGDTICYAYVTALAQYREILNSMGDYKNAFNALMREKVIYDSIYKREKYQISIEMATAYKVKEQEAATALAQQKVKWMSAVIVLLIIIIVSTITYSVITIRRTKALARSIKERIDNEDLRNNSQDSGNTTPAETASTEPVQDSNASDTNYKALFKKMDELVKNEKLYLNPNLQRDDLAKMVNISKNDFANFIQQNAGCNTNTYINNLRLEYAVRTLVHEPEYKISAVAELSGIPNLSTFYRLFTERYGITPVKFAKNIAAN